MARCKRCGKEHDGEKSLCEKCRARQKEYYRKHYFLARERRLCPQCGKPVERGYVVCQECRTKRKGKKSGAASGSRPQDGPRLQRKPP